MKRIVAVVLILCLLCGCGTKPQTEETITITDHAGNTVEVPAQIDRIAVCDIYPLPSVLSVFFDSAEKIVAMAPNSMQAAENSLLSQLYPEILNADTTAISGPQMNMEELIALEPQVVFYNTADPELGEELRSAGFSAVGVSVDQWGYDAVNTLNQWIALLSQMFPQYAGERAKAVSDYAQEVVNLIWQRTKEVPEKEKIMFLFQYTDAAIVTNGRNSFGQWWANTIGAVNVAQEMTDNGSGRVTMEQVYAWNPSQILITNFNPAQPEDLYQNTMGSYDWSGIAAVENKKVYKLPLGMYRSFTPGVDTPIALLWMAKTVYPDLFKDIDILEKTEEYYKTVFDIQLTDAQAESIFAPANSAGNIAAVK